MLLNKYGIKSKNILLLYIIQLVEGLIFFLPVIALYLENDLFSLTNVAIIFSIEAILIAVFEIPTGAISDLFGRKRTLILGSISCLIGFVFLYIGGSMIMFVLFAIFNAAARSLYSGTENALIYDTLKEEKKEKYYKKIIGTFYALWPFGAIAGSLIGGYIAAKSLSLTVLLTFIPFSVILVLLFFLKEPKYKKEDHKNVLKHVVESSKIIISNSQLILIFVAGFLVWGLGESMHRLISLFFTFKEIPVLYFGVITAFIFGFSSLGFYLSNYVSGKIGDKKTLILSTIGTPLFLLIAILSTKYTTAVFWALASIFFGLRNPIIDHLINRGASSSKRATILSSYSFVTRVGMAICVPLIGYFAELYTINVAFKISAILMFIVPVIFLFLREKKD